MIQILGTKSEISSSRYHDFSGSAVLYNLAWNQDNLKNKTYMLYWQMWEMNYIIFTTYCKQLC